MPLSLGPLFVSGSLDDCVYGQKRNLLNQFPGYVSLAARFLRKQSIIFR